ncbi:hypothetical protein [Spirosoma validum]|uniref:Outer membrane beta-barrel protein n=1 Tax=Spirosoma validum TaxID=2771355 RepID=A0A927GDE4_9BACT|nr:hypothetical protein [Spirosoma validum]MBD2753712.1 hypothetical protein [Spirosoma validum]
MSFFYRLFLAVFFCGLVATQSRAQSQSGPTAPYLIFKTTYAFPAGSQKINEASTIVNNKTFTKGIYGSYGQGINLSLGVGKMLNPTFGVELDAQVMLGNAITTTYATDEFNLSGSQSDRVRSVLLKPFIVIRNSGDLLAIYTKLGLAISTYGRRYEQEEVIYTFNGQTYQQISESTETANVKVGFAACFGLSFRIAESVSVFAEANGQIMALPFTKGHYTKYTENGKDVLPSKSTSEQSWVYERSTTSDPNAPADDSRPGVRLYDPAYFSYMGIGVGFIYHF